MSTALLIARALTTKVSYVPGSDAVLDPLIKRWGKNHEGTIVVNDFDGDLKFELSLDAEEDSRIFFYGALAQPVLALLHRVVRSGHTVVDVGAGAGEVSLFAAKRAGESGRVVAVEPREAQAGRLTRNLSLNRFEQVDVLRMSLGARPSARDEEPAMSSLDQLHDEGWFSQLDVLKLGQGHVDVDVLEGGRSVLDEFAPFIVLEGGSAGAAEVSRVLGDMGYRFYRVDREKGLPLFKGQPPYRWAVACPPGKTVG